MPPLRGASVLADASLSAPGVVGDAALTPSETSPRTAVPRDVGGAPPRAAPRRQPSLSSRPLGALQEELESALWKAQEALLKKQNFEDGYWCGDLRADTTLESDTIMLLHFLGRGRNHKVRALANHIFKHQNPDGGWPIYRNGPSDLSATVKAYWALKLAGHLPQDHRLISARIRIDALGGIHRVNTYCKFYMALFGQYDWRGVPTLPPELMLFPRWFYFSIYDMSSWTRCIVVPLTLLWALKPKVDCPDYARLDELFPDARRHIPVREMLPRQGFLSWRNFLLLWDEGLRALEGRGPHWIRKRSMRLAERWILERVKDSDGLGAIYPGIVNTLMAMRALGYSENDSRFKRQLAILENLELDRGDSLEMQPCFSPIWDTALSTAALAQSGVAPDSPALRRAALWLMSKEVQRAGDWKVGNPRGPIGGWAFEFANAFYPDVDDTAMVILALRQVRLPEPLSIQLERAVRRGLHWVLSMQCRGGGWAAFDRDNTMWVLTKIPFADHNAIIDPPSADLTGRVLEMLGGLGYDGSHPSVRSGVEYLKKEQEPDGSWYGRWGVNYLYGTWQALRGLASVGEDPGQACIQKAAEWLRCVQHSDGGWGETCATYENASLKGMGPSTPSQTAWALMGLLAAGAGPEDAAVQRGIRHLLETQNEDGTWNEEEFTGTGFPKVFYLEYTLYRDLFPLMALGVYRRELATLRPPRAAPLRGTDVLGDAALTPPRAAARSGGSDAGAL